MLSFKIILLLFSNNIFMGKSAQKNTKTKVGKVFLVITLLLLSFSILVSVTLTIFFEPRVNFLNFTTFNSDNLASANATITILDYDDKDASGKLYGDNRLFTPLSKVPQHTIDAFISIEDRRFYDHKGIDYRRIFGAAKNNIASGSKKEGASTITQQLIKNTHLTPDKTYRRKIEEARLAREVERKYSKDQILESYLNILYFGNSIYGIGTAAKAMFNIDVTDLNLAQSALLAGIINSPARFSPYHNLEQATLRRNLVLDSMYQNGKITIHQLENAKRDVIYVLPLVHTRNQYFSMVLADAAKALKINQRQLFKKNITIATHYDSNLNNNIANVLNEYMCTVESSDELLGKIIAICNKSGSTLATATHGDARFSNLRRSPGSSLKPIICYAPILERGIAIPATPILDERANFSGYSPTNYRGHYAGWTSMSNSLATSSNAASLKLLNMNGVHRSKKLAQNLGIDFSANDNSLALALGAMSHGTTLRQLTNAYLPFANNGCYIASCSIRYIKDSNGNYLYKARPKEQRVLKDSTAYLMAKMLQECASNTGTAKLLAHKNIKYVGGKTGTVGNSSGNTDAYCIAITPLYTVGVWIGTKDSKGEKMQVGGGGTPSLIARDTMLMLKRNSNFNTDFARPKSVIEVDIDLNEYNNRHRLVRANSDLKPRFTRTIQAPKGFKI